MSKPVLMESPDVNASTTDPYQDPAAFAATPLPAVTNNSVNTYLGLDPRELFTPEAIGLLNASVPEGTPEGHDFKRRDSLLEVSNVSSSRIVATADAPTPSVFINIPTPFANLMHPHRLVRSAIPSAALTHAAGEQRQQEIAGEQHQVAELARVDSAGRRDCRVR